MAVTYGIQVVAAEPFTPNTLAQECHEAFALVMPEISVEVSLLQTEVLATVDPAPAPPASGVYSLTVQGGAAGSIVPQNTAYLVHKRSGTGGRGGRGRMYLPGVGESVVDNTGNVSAGKLNGLQTALNLFIVELADGPDIEDMVILHNSPGAYALAAPTRVTSLVIDPVVATQRRRLRR
jgi:hypothetical protein